MARRVGVTMHPLSAIDRILAVERRDQWDIYPSLDRMRLEITDPLAPAVDRFRLHVNDDGHERVCRMSATALNQICSMAGIPTAFLERVPANLALKLMRCMLEMSDLGDGRRVLLRMKAMLGPKVRAVLPQSYVCLNDQDVLSEVKEALEGADVRVGSVSVENDTFFLRLLFKDELNLGSTMRHDPGRCGIDVISSETGCHALEIRHVLYRLICSNGLTVRMDAPKALKVRYTQMDRGALESMLQTALGNVMLRGHEMADRMADSHAQMIEDPKEEIEAIFRRYNLGSVRGKLGRWVAHEVVQNLSLFGVKKFDVIQAFTAVARGLDHRDRMRFEDAMGEYLVDERRRN